MYLLPLLALLGTAFCVPLTEDVSSTTRDDRAERYLLPTDVIPSFYDVILHIDPNNHENFNGEVSIRVMPLNSTNEIVMHAFGMQITPDAIQVYPDVDPTENLLSSFELADDDTQFLRIQLNRNLVVLQPIIVNIKYTSDYATNMFGIYVSSYNEGSNTVSLVTSQLQPTYARRAFPCFDEPALKAIFRITIYAPPTHPIVRTNMPLRTDLLKPAIPGWNKFEFQDTPVMSTYIHGFLVSNFDSISNEANPIYRKPMRIYSRPGTQDTATFALDFAQNSMNALEKYYDFEYYPPKLDKVGVPDFAAGAMENWGLVIYREVALLVSDELTTTATRQNVARLITHENVHLWLGNEVSPVSWSYLWLNEGFATFYEHYACDLVRPDFRMEDQLLLSVQNVLQADAVLSVNPMTFPVYTPSEVLGTFNSVAYAKSGSVIRMLRHFLTPEVFNLGMSYYIKAMSRKAASPSDLYAALQRALTESDHVIEYSIETIMERWTTQGGFPVLTITRSASSANSVVVAQERFLTDRSSNSTDRWHVPINWVISTNPDFSDTRPMDWIPPTFPARAVTIDGLADADWYIINKQQTGYYRVNYDEANWIALINAFHANHEVFHYLNRANILDDAFNLARNDRLSYNHAFNLSHYLVDETDYIPWAAVNPAFSYLDVALSESESYPAFQNYIRNITEPLYDQLGFNQGSQESHVTAFHRNIILDLNCRHGNTDCIDTAATLLREFIDNESQRPRPDIQTVVYCSALRGGSVENFNFLWDMYLRSTDSSEQSILLNALGCTTNMERRIFFLDQVISQNSEVREQDRHTIIVSVINSSPESTNVALDFVHENFHLIQPRVQGLTGTTNILNAFARRLTSQAHSDKIDEFADLHASIFTAGELAAIAGIKENIAASINWSRQNAETVENWLEAHYGNSAAVFTSSLIVLISVVVTIFNR